MKRTFNAISTTNASRCVVMMSMALAMVSFCVLARGAEDAKSKDNAANLELSQAGVQAAFQILRQDYIRSGELNFEQMNRAALAGLMSHLDGGAKVVPVAESQEEAKEPEVLRAALAESIGWVRPLTYTVEEVAEWTKALKELHAQDCRTLVLDLREATPAGTFEAAAAFLETLVPSGQVLFKLKQAGKSESQLQTQVRVSSQEPLWAGPMVVLVDAGTNNVGETIAAVLRHQRRAWVLGEQTVGATVRYQSLPLDERFALQYASAELLLEDGSSLFQKGLTPDLKVVMTAEEKAAARHHMAQGRVRELVHEVARERFNEAALVARRNPELEDYLKRSVGEKASGESLPPTDAVLQRAVDAVLSHETLGEAKLIWKSPAADGDTQKEEILKAPPVVPMSGSR